MTISQILTVEQVAELLNVKPSWIYMRTCDGALRGTRIQWIQLNEFPASNLAGYCDLIATKS
jgi:hypothetical protein